MGNDNNFISVDRLRNAVNLHTLQDYKLDMATL